MIDGVAGQHRMLGEQITEGGHRGSRGRPALADHCDEVTGLDDVAYGHTDLADRPGHLGDHRDLHLHRLQQHQGVALTDLIALVHHDLEHTGHDLRANILGHLHPIHIGCLPLYRTTTTWGQGAHRLMREWTERARRMRTHTFLDHTEVAPWPSVAARSVTVSIRRPTTASGPTPARSRCASRG